jgi:hypothetical protein
MGVLRKFKQKFSKFQESSDQAPASAKVKEPPSRLDLFATPIQADDEYDSDDGIDIANFSCADELQHLGAPVLKAELRRLGLKFGGNVKMQADRLWLHTHPKTVAQVENRGNAKSAGKKKNIRPDPLSLARAQKQERQQELARREQEVAKKTRDRVADIARRKRKHQQMTLKKRGGQASMAHSMKSVLEKIQETS